MNNEIIININEANKAQKYQNENELFQIEAFKIVSEILKEHKVDDNKTKDITDCRFHDTIFIDGDRGVGKTAFMINIENYYKNIAKIETPKYIFLKPVDPTLLEHTEKFLGVVFGKIVEMVSNQLNNNSDERNNYYETLEHLSKSLSAVSSIKNGQDDGIEEIASYKSSLKLEQYAHEFFQIVCKMFDVNAIVMLIDDVDMAFDKGFDVLEVVRKYLASPYLIPIVAGDMNLYREIIETKFIEKIKFYDDVKYLKDSIPQFIDSKEYKDKQYLLNNLVEQYFHKIFPNEYRIELKSIFTIIRENLVTVKFSDLDIPFTEIKDFEIRHLNFGINQKQFTFKIFEDNTRKLIQYLTSKKEIYSNFFRKIDYPKDTKYESYLPQKVIVKYDKFIVPFLQTIDYKKSLEITYNILKESKNNDLVKYLQNDLKSEYLISDELKNLLPFKEQENEDFVITHKNLQVFLDKKSDYKDIENYIINLFIYNDYKKESFHQTKNFIYTGKFVELIIYSLFIKEKVEIDIKNIQKVLEKIKGINFDNLINNEDYEIYSTIFDKTSDDLSEKSDLLESSNYFNKLEINIDLLELSLIPNNIPFNSSKINDKNNDKNEIEEEVVIDYVTVNLSRTLILWKNIFAKELVINSTTLYRILDKFYENLSYMKKQQLNDSPLEFLQRIVLIFINSVAYFESTNLKIANTNIAIGNEFDLKTALTKTNASTLNIKPLIGENLTLTKALFFHPVISHILFPDETSKLNSLLFPEKKIIIDKNLNIKTKKGNISFNTFNNIYQVYFSEAKLRDKYKGQEAVIYEEYLSKMVEKLAEASDDVIFRLKFAKFDAVFKLIDSLEVKEQSLDLLLTKYKKLVY